MKKKVFNPWEVSGDVNYKKLVKEFGITPLKQLPKELNKELLFRRGILFASRDIGRVLNAIKQKKKAVIMTGLMPTGSFHIGHMLLIKELIFFQKLGLKIYLAIADLEAYHARGQSLEESKKIAKEYLKDYAALGLNLNKCDVYFQSNRSKDAKISNAYYRLQNLLARHATFNEFKGVYGEITPGKMLASLLQAADMLHPQLKELEGKCPILVPVGIDQDPHIRLARDLQKRIKVHDFLPLSSIYHLFMPGLGGGKMSASDPISHIAMTDPPKEVKKKINKYAFSGGKETIAAHRKHGGNPDVDTAFQYLRFFFEPNDKKLQKIEKDYKKGTLLSGELKTILIKNINDFLKEHQKKRRNAKLPRNLF